MHFDSRYLELLNACIFKLIYVLLNVGNGIEFQYPSIVFLSTVKPVLRGHSKRRTKLVFKTDYRLMKVESIAECSLGAFCNIFDRH